MRNVCVYPPITDVRSFVFSAGTVPFSLIVIERRHHCRRVFPFCSDVDVDVCPCVSQKHCRVRVTI